MILKKLSMLLLVLPFFIGTVLAETCVSPFGVDDARGESYDCGKGKVPDISLPKWDILSSDDDDDKYEEDEYDDDEAPSKAKKPRRQRRASRSSRRESNYIDYSESCSNVASSNRSRCERLEMLRMGGTSPEDCPSCFAAAMRQDEERSNPWIEALGIVAQPLAQFGISYYNSKHNKDNYSNCLSDIQGTIAANQARGANPILWAQSSRSRKDCTKVLSNGGYAGYNQMSGNRYGGFQGNPMQSAGYNSGFLNGMNGQYGQFGMNNNGQFGMNNNGQFGMNGRFGMNNNGQFGMNNNGIGGMLNGILGVGAQGINGLQSLFNGQNGMNGRFGMNAQLGMNGRFGMNNGYNLNGGNIGNTSFGINGYPGNNSSYYGNTGYQGQQQQQFIQQSYTNAGHARAAGNYQFASQNLQNSNYGQRYNDPYAMGNLRGNSGIFGGIQGQAGFQFQL